MALDVSSVIKNFGEKTVVDNLSFKIENPGVFGLLGTNGAGKTTTIRMILGILEKDSGSISVEWTTCYKGNCKIWISTRGKRLIS